MPVQRLPLAVDIENRSPNYDSDGRVINAYLELEDDVIYVVKRGGTTLEVTGGGIAAGMFVYSGYLFHWDASNTATTPSKILVSSLP